ncbi:MAG: hypothetical protein V7784_17545 [Oceanospirillaceae bacterium]
MSEFVNTTPQSSLRRSMLCRVQETLGAQFAEHQGAIVVRHFNSQLDEERAQLKSLAIIDLSTLPRSGFKGREAPQWLTDKGVNIPETPNQAVKQDDGSIVARLSMQEHLILSDLAISASLPAKLEQSWSMQSDVACYSLPRNDSHAWLYLTGSEVRAMLSKVCGIDLRDNEFANLSIAQTSIARINGILIRDDLVINGSDESSSAIPAFHLLCDSSSVAFVWESMCDAMNEFDGKPVGFAALLNEQ